MSDLGRVVVWIPYGAPGWELQPAHPYDAAWIAGGIRTLHELAVALACTGRDVELRGAISLPVLDELSAAAGARPELPVAPRPPVASDTVIVPEGIEDPLVFGRLALSPARLALMVLGPPGLLGWPFAAAWEQPDPLTVEVDAVARSTHFRAAAALGYELWTHSPGLQRVAESSGLRCRFLGTGQPAPFPDPPEAKDVDVLTIGDNRWAPLASEVVVDLARRGIRSERAATQGRAQMLATLGRARILLHPARVEGHSRLGCEARAMGAVPVALSTHPYAVGLDEAGGAVAVGSVRDMADAVEELLADPARLDALAATAMTSARMQVEWDPYLQRVRAALDRVDDDPGREARAEIGAALRAHDEAGQLAVAELEAELAQRIIRADAAEAALRGARADAERHRQWLESVNGSLSWRATAPLRAANRRLGRQ